MLLVFVAWDANLTESRCHRYLIESIA
ncbi:hypothetical protein DSM3645_03098 [Blastopirellula marina DSM 3645]|uniref:Uncharacterized protein n=1 Tax=Blastopirellula marina DSM 3645 TaxID=314230 RepID=A3ZVT3_9BACT|nr:hypothetical protein DSM3645_03098 [Blastopirellula marina DSM 3645]